MTTKSHANLKALMKRHYIQCPLVLSVRCVILDQVTQSCVVRISDVIVFGIKLYFNMIIQCDTFTSVKRMLTPAGTFISGFNGI